MKRTMTLVALVWTVACCREQPASEKISIPDFFSCREFDYTPEGHPGMRCRMLACNPKSTAQVLTTLFCQPR